MEAINAYPEEKAWSTDAFVVGTTITSREEEEPPGLKDSTQMAGALSSNTFIEDLPEEILCTIFDILCRDIGREARFPLVSLPSQVILSHVCASWRQIVLDMPYLWRTVTVRHSDRHSQYISHARGWLSRARNLPVDVTMARPVEQRVFDDLMLRLRFRMLNANLPLTLLPKLFALPKEALEPMQILTITSPPDGWTTSHLFMIPDHAFPHLETLSLYLYAGPDFTKHDSFPCLASGGKLRELDIGSVTISLSQFVRILQRAPLLSTCYVSLTTPEETSTATVVLRHLKVIELWFRPDCPSQACNELLQLLVVPNLVRFRIRTFPNPPVSLSHDAFRAMVYQSEGLQALRVLDVLGASSALPARAVLDCLPFLEEIHLPKAAELDDELVEQVAMGQIGARLRRLVADSIEPLDVYRMASKRAAYAVVKPGRHPNINPLIRPFEVVRIFHNSYTEYGTFPEDMQELNIQVMTGGTLV